MISKRLFNRKQKLVRIIFCCLITLAAAIWSFNPAQAEEKTLVPVAPSSNNAYLSDLILSTGELSTLFSPEVTSYTQNVNHFVSAVHVTPTAEERHADITVNGTPVASGQSTAAINLEVGDHVITIQVTAPDGKTVNTYFITVNRHATEVLSTEIPASPTPLGIWVYKTNATLSWTDNSLNEDGFIIERSVGNGNYASIGRAPANATRMTDSGLSPGTTYYYRIAAYNSTGISVFSEEGPAATSAVLRFYSSSPDYYVNDQKQTMEVSPIIINGRMLLPISYVAAPLGTSVAWNEDEQKITISTGAFYGRTIELWIGQSTAKINGEDMPICPDNPSMAPVIIPPGHTMLPLRFITKYLGCQVDWDSDHQAAVITYPSWPYEGNNSSQPDPYFTSYNVRDDLERVLIKGENADHRPVACKIRNLDRQSPGAPTFVVRIWVDPGYDTDYPVNTYKILQYMNDELTQKKDVHFTNTHIDYFKTINGEKVRACYSQIGGEEAEKILAYGDKSGNPVADLITLDGTTPQADCHWGIGSGP